ncbi:MAG: class C sortase [Trueperella sp.]|uniref:class C sortase n=1 Tax=Trueperella sp. TaxID=2699835 RepID=UPI0025F70DE9|nr:class C sortase [Trueperella sp.]MCI7306403.1 class C sortase [Trueperella sp.]
MLLAGAAVYLYPQTAAWFSQREQARVIEKAQGVVAENEAKRPNPYVVELERAREYNDALASGVTLEANANVPKGSGALPDGLDYSSLLADEEGVMGRLYYSTLDIDLPIYHGTSEETLLKGIGHLEGTSLPVGGIGQRSVLTAHRGLPESTLFTNLDQARVGDIFTIAVLDQVISYRVVDTRVIEPSESEVLFADPERDLVTLITCTPLGINTHRIVVTGERIIPTPAGEVAQAEQPSELPHFPWWAVIFGAVFLLVTMYVWRSGYVHPRRSESDKTVLADASTSATHFEGE